MGNKHHIVEVVAVECGDGVGNESATYATAAILGKCEKSIEISASQTLAVLESQHLHNAGGEVAFEFHEVSHGIEVDASVVLHKRAFGAYRCE